MDQNKDPSNRPASCREHDQHSYLKTPKQDHDKPTTLAAITPSAKPVSDNDGSAVRCLSAFAESPGPASARLALPDARRLPAGRLPLVSRWHVHPCSARQKAPREPRGVSSVQSPSTQFIQTRKVAEVIHPITCSQGDPLSTNWQPRSKLPGCS